jgi:hypothetical protein
MHVPHLQFERELKGGVISVSTALMSQERTDAGVDIGHCYLTVRQRAPRGFDKTEGGNEVTVTSRAANQQNTWHRSLPPPRMRFRSRCNGRSMR